MKKEAKSRDAIMTTDTLSNDFESITHAFPLHSFPSSNFALPYAKSFSLQEQTNRKPFVTKDH